MKIHLPQGALLFSLLGLTGFTATLLSEGSLSVLAFELGAAGLVGAWMHVALTYGLERRARVLLKVDSKDTRDRRWH